PPRAGAVAAAEHRARGGARRTRGADLCLWRGESSSRQPYQRVTSPGPQPLSHPAGVDGAGGPPVSRHRPGTGRVWVCGGEPMTASRLLSTGNDTLDQILGGGIPRNAVIVVAGGPGTGQTILHLQILF